MTQLAFIISAHTDPVHLNRMIKSLPENSEFYVHVDSKSDIKDFKKLIDSENVHFVEPRINVMWGSIGVVDSQMIMINEAIKSSHSFNYLISLSGLDYPLWDNQRILHFFETNKNKEFLYGVPMKDQGENSVLYQQHRPYNYKYWKYGSLKSKFRVALRKSIYALGIRKSLQFTAEGKHYDLYKGSMWWAITPKLATFVYNTWKVNKDYRNYFYDSFAPDETFIHTLVFNSDYAANSLGIVNTFTKLEDITPLTYIDYTDNIKIFTINDYDELMNSGKMFFRKAVTGISDSLLDKIDEARNCT